MRHKLNHTQTHIHLCHTGLDWEVLGNILVKDSEEGEGEDERLQSYHEPERSSSETDVTDA